MSCMLTRSCWADVACRVARTVDGILVNSSGLRLATWIWEKNLNLPDHKLPTSRQDHDWVGHDTRCFHSSAEYSRLKPMLQNFFELNTKQDSMLFARLRWSFRTKTAREKNNKWLFSLYPILRPSQSLVSGLF